MEGTEEKLASHISLKKWKRIFPYVKRIKLSAVLVLIFMLVSALSESVYPMFTSFAVNSFVVPGTTDGIWKFFAAFGGAILIGGAAVIIYCHNAITVEMQLGKMLKRECFVHLQRLPLSYYNKSSVGYLLARVMSDTDRISGVIAWGIVHLLWHVCYIVGAFACMFALNARLAAILLVIIPVVAIVTWFFQKKILVVNRSVRHINSQITGAYNEGITGAKTSKTLVIEDKNCREFSGLTTEMYKKSVISSMLTAILLPLVLFCGSAAVAVVLQQGGKSVMVGGLDLGVLSAFITYAVAIIDPVVQIANVFSDIITAQVCIERVTNLIDEPCTIEDTPEVIAKYGDVFEPKRENWEKIHGDIAFEHVWFRYPDGGEYVLEDFSLTVPAGSTVAIVGETGAGKSTIVNLVCRFFEPTKGRILIDGKDIKERSQLWLHSSLGYVLQDPHLFSGTIADNIRYGKLDATDEEVRRAAELVSADKIAAKFETGYDTYVGESGDRLSTGEKQLISFARALIADPPIFVLDEATSSIDTETEQLIQNAISRVLHGRTSFIIAHRLSTIRHADMILVVDKGKIIERGTHSELIEKNGHYAGLYRAMEIEEK